MNNFALTLITLDTYSWTTSFVLPNYDNSCSCLILKGTFQRADNWSWGIRKEISRRCYVSTSEASRKARGICNLSIAGKSLNAFCPSPQCLHRNDLGILAAMSWFRTKILITIKPLPWQTFPVIFMKTSAITGTQFLTVLTEALYGVSGQGQPLSFWNLHWDQWR